MARAEFSKKTKLEIWLREKGHCQVCRGKIISGAEYHHAVPASLGGSNAAENGELHCARCHRLRTRKIDVPQIAKSQRVLEKRAGLRKPKGRPLPGTKASGWRHRVNGAWERRT